MQIIYSLIICFLPMIVLSQEVPIPANYSIVDTVTGDLDNDNYDELVVAYNTELLKENESVPRELIIYKLENGEWAIWKKSTQALMGSKDGGMMGDPFEEIEITKGTLLIIQSGGSSWKWRQTDKYRYQDGEFYLIGFSSYYGKLCEYWEDVDFNLSTGKMLIKKEYERCENQNQEFYKRENETVFEKDLIITLQQRNEKEIKIVTPKYQHVIYISVPKEQ